MGRLRHAFAGFPDQPGMLLQIHCSLGKEFRPKPYLEDIACDLPCPHFTLIAGFICGREPAGECCGLPGDAGQRPSGRAEKPLARCDFNRRGSRS